MYRWRVEINFLQITFHMRITVTLVVWLMPLQTRNKRRESPPGRGGKSETDSEHEVPHNLNFLHGVLNFVCYSYHAITYHAKGNNPFLFLFCSH